MSTKKELRHQLAVARERLNTALINVHEAEQATQSTRNDLSHSHVVRERLSTQVARYSTKVADLEQQTSGDSIIKDHQSKMLTKMGQEIMSLEGALRRGWNWQQYQFAKAHPDEVKGLAEAIINADRSQAKEAEGIDTRERREWIAKGSAREDVKPVVVERVVEDSADGSAHDLGFGVQAMKWTGKNRRQIESWSGRKVQCGKLWAALNCESGFDWPTECANIGEWILKNEGGTYSKLDDAAFRKKFDKPTCCCDRRVLCPVHDMEIHEVP